MEIYGRERELARLDSFLESLPSGSAAFLLEGEPGIGKTTVWRAGVDAAEARGYRVLLSRPAEAESSLSYAGLADLLDRLDDATLGSLPEPQSYALDVALLRQSAGDRPPDARSVFAALTTILRLLGAEQPTVVAVDDAQWLDGPTTRALEFAGRRLDGTPVGLLAAARIGERPAASSFARSELFRLEPLSAAALHQLVKRRLDWSMPRPTLLRLHAACDGNAFFALELARALDDAGRPDPRDAWPIPDDLRLLVEQRVEQLPHSVRESLLRAAAVSQPTTELLEPDALQAVEETGLVTVGPGNRVHFAHPLYASAIYAGTTSEARRALHAELAATEDDAEERARHLALAAVAPDESVAAELDIAAANARNRGAPEIAGELVERALELTPLGHPATFGRALTAAADFVRAGSLTRAAALLGGVAEGSDDAPVRAQALRLLAQIRVREERFAEAWGLLHAALEQAGETPDIRALVELDLAYAGINVSLDHTPAGLHADAALAYAEQSGDPGLIAPALTFKAIVDFLLSQGLDEERLSRALELEQHGDAPLELQPALAAGCLAFYVGRFDDARDFLLPLRSSALERGGDADLTLLLVHLAWLECAAGDYAAARRFADEALESAALAAAVMAQSLAFSAFLGAHTGDAERARQQAREAIDLTGPAENCLVVQWAWGALGQIELAVGNAAGAKDALEPLTSFYERHDVLEPLLTGFMPDAVEAHVILGELDRATRLVELLERSAEHFDRPAARATALRCRALLLATKGNFAVALAAVDRAVLEHDAVAMPLELARTLLVKGQIERRAKHRAAARGSLERALSICEELGAELWAEKARADVARLGARREPDELTATEERVATLAASGLTNREVAAAAFVSQKTVEANLSRVYRKLGIRSRAELGLRLVERASSRAPLA